MRYLRIVAITAMFISVSGFTDCYKPVTNSGLPKHIKTVAVPTFQFEASGLRYKIESRFTEAVVREIIRRGSGLKVQGKVEGADAVIDGNIRDFAFTGVLLDRDGRAEVFLKTAEGASTAFATPYRYDGTSLREVTLDGTPARLGYGGGVTHGDGFRCLASGQLEVRQATSADGKAFTVQVTSYRLTGAALVRAG